ncbi:MAG: HAMP domain-containing sensor histidine kinase [Bacteroidota bacterium]
MESLKNNLINCPTVLTGISHEMRTHMNAIVAFSFLMKENSCNNTERNEFSNQIVSSCEQFMELFDSFLDSAKIDSGNSNVKSKICRIDNMLDDLLLEFSEVIRKEGPLGLELVIDIRFPNSAEVLIDQNMIFRIIRSLFHNSIKNTLSGYIKIGFFCNDDKLTFYVLDSGQGYAKCKEFLNSEDMNESLTQHDDTYTAINISLAKKLIRILDGTIWIEHNDVAGTGIYFSIPVKIVAGSDKNINEHVYSKVSI